jgi:hypothetical protein
MGQEAADCSADRLAVGVQQQVKGAKLPLKLGRWVMWIKLRRAKVLHDRRG